MLSQDLQFRIWKAAKAQGLGGEDFQASAPAVQEGEGFWNSRLSSLLEAGGGSQQDLDTLAWDAIGRERGSWVDPLFLGPRPIADLPGLGDRYRDLEPLGEGATAEVFSAFDTLLQRQVALKVLKLQGGSALAEARAQARVEHPNICRIYEVGQGFIAMQLVRGPHLAGLAPTLDRTQQLQVVRDVAQGVHAAHLQGLVHLDLKLNNILVEAREEGGLTPIVGDFGMVIAHSREATGVCPMGTPPYSSPEQLAGDASRLDPRSDVYALGVMLYVLLAGTSPFRATHFRELLQGIARGEVVPLGDRLPGIPKDLAAIVHGCLGKDPATRYGSALDLAQEIDRFLSGLPVKVMGASKSYRIGKWLRRHRRLATAIGIGLCALALSSAIGLARARFIYERAEWDHHFQTIVEDLRVHLDHAYHLPSHNIEPTLERAGLVIRGMETEMADNGKVALGPGYLALGQAKLLIKPTDPEAAECFRKAWELGYRTEGARTWLAYALLAQAWAQGGRPGGRGAERLDPGIQHTLQSVRQLLKGRGGPDQDRLAERAEWVEAWEGFPGDDDRLLTLARARRNRNPQNLESYFNEVIALRRKENRMWIQAVEKGGRPPAQVPEEITALRVEALAVLREALRIAPSNPRIYLMLTQCLENRDIRPLEPGVDRGALLRDAEAWVRKGQEIAPHDLNLLEEEAQLATHVLDYDLSRGAGPSAAARRLVGALERVLAWGEPRNALSLMSAIQAFSWQCEVHGVSSAPLAADVCGRLRGAAERSGPGDFQRAYFPLLCLTLGHTLLDQGLDPAPVIRASGWQSSPAQEPVATLLPMCMNLLKAEHMALVDPEATQPLEEAVRYLEAWKAFPLAGSELEIQIRTLQARWLGTPHAWRELARCLEPSKAQRADALGPRAETLARARLCLITHRMEQGGEVRDLQLSTREALLKAIQEDARNLPLRATLAELDLQAFGLRSEGTAVLEEDLTWVERAIAATRPDPGRGASPVLGMSSNFLEWQEPPRLGRLCMVRGRLLMALSSRQPVALRCATALKALSALREAQRFNRNLQMEIRPLQVRARLLATP